MVVECPGCKNRYDVTGRPPGTSARCRCGTVFRLPEPSSAAGGISCPSCGAAVAPTAHTCEFCAHQLLVRACPRCFARLFHGNKHCPACGVEVGVPAQAGPDGRAAPRTCPGCAARPALVARLVGNVLIDECTTCHGVWLDAAAVDRVVRERGEDAVQPLREMGGPAADLDHAGSPAGPAPGVLGAAPRRMYLPCPDCAAMMNRVNFARRSGIILDVCRAHGTWFDNAELPRVVDFVLKGGIEASQKKDLEDAREAARQVKAEAEAARATEGFHQPYRGHGAFEVDLFSSAIGLIGRLLR